MISWGAMSLETEAAAAALAVEGIEATVLDLRWLAPLDDEAIADAVATSGGRVLIVHEANETGGFGAEIASRISSRQFSALSAPVRRLATPDVRIPASPVLQEALIPNAGAIVVAARQLLST